MLSESLPTLSSPYAQHWSIDPSIRFLNHGSFGACPTAVLEKQRSLQAQLELEPLRFFERELEPLLDAARNELASFVGADEADVVFVPNATTGINTVLRSLTFQAGDELLTTNHEYNASRNALNFAAERSGARVIVADIPFPIASADCILDILLAHLSSRTRLVLLDHVTSQTGMIFPIEAIVQSLTAQGVDVLVDGAHAPGMVPLQLNALGATYYTGNCHKWLCAPKGAAFLYVRPEKQAAIRPLVISHGANSPRTDRSRFHLEFDWTGTADPTAYLCVPEAIRLIGSLMPGGWSAVMSHNRSMALAARQRLCDALNVAPPCPEEMIGSMAVVPLSMGTAERLADKLKQSLFDRYQIEVPVVPWHSPPWMVRVSAQLYNTLSDYDVLARALVDLQCGTG
ncbi:aminotransferase class V-fold PLP-dependent enzyme [Oculatella sp. LEGE 06141]|uniref:aminotransferase class V-fold PLP-dependent enzyme n=1 Tax=Oculatella sp. LEGE 06141 TaxID=1828648 RepID=UPI001880EAE6|nr:aminotransferase class V-fold PLP-dependent enzyme [Oculatella sp. LEGE 06141]MBE9178884.1 aminotransferase class V-fold PLP-dependent enzyme [Oculatella sp. LEGE 06141]